MNVNHLVFWTLQVCGRDDLKPIYFPPRTLTEAELKAINKAKQRALVGERGAANQIDAMRVLSDSYASQAMLEEANEVRPTHGGFKPYTLDSLSHVVRDPFQQIAKELLYAKREVKGELSSALRRRAQKLTRLLDLNQGNISRAIAGFDDLELEKKMQIMMGLVQLGHFDNALKLLDQTKPIDERIAFLSVISVTRFQYGHTDYAQYLEQMLALYTPQT